MDNLVQWILAPHRLQRVIWLRLRVIWPATVEWVPSVTPLVARLVTQALLRRLMLQMPLLVLRWTVPPPKVARLVLMQEPEP